MLELPKPEELKAAYGGLEFTANAFAAAEEERIDAQLTLDQKYARAYEDAKADELPDARAQQKALKATREELTAFHVAEKKARAANSVYRLAGMVVDHLNRQVDLAKVTLKAKELGLLD